MRSQLIILFFLILSASCIRDELRSNHHDLEWITGTWADTSAGYYELWRKEGGKYMGEGFTLAGNDTLFREHLQISGTDGWTYYATVEDQNDGRQIPFRLVNYDPDSLVFENLNHDFPNQIIYSRSGDSSLHIVVKSATGERSFQLKMKKISR